MNEDKEQWQRFDAPTDQELAEDGITRLEELGWLLAGSLLVEAETEEQATLLGDQLAETLRQVPGLTFVFKVGQVSLAAVRLPNAPKDS